MCTVTFLPLSNTDFMLTSNRDEQPQRETLHPKIWLQVVVLVVSVRPDEAQLTVVNVDFNDLAGVHVVPKNRVRPGAIPDLDHLVEHRDPVKRALLEPR